jgi:nicotinate-nucleotide adenylyltransferase
MPTSPDLTPPRSSATVDQGLRRLCFGGTFNPIHHGHLICARAAAEAGEFDRVTLIPSAVPPHKSNLRGSHDIASAQDRLAMCRLAIEGDPLFEADNIELQRSSPSFTIDTVRELNRRGGWENISWLIGGDMVPTLPTWHEPSALLAEVQFIVMDRPGSRLDWNLLPKSLQVLKSQAVVPPLIEISASEIRSRIHDGRSVRYLTPDAVANYIVDRGLYR